ncbi:TPA: hypothetical protein ACGY76_003301 [Clostridioides difficile]|uniref:hypothetical protein n=1 Tax=unclassified Exiguobacterium TaxID=2644629 RepID=UPI001BE5E8BB|nr:hypothetical protein [Exiguobacterium sp. s144]
MTQKRKSRIAVLSYIVVFLFMILIYQIIKWISDYKIDYFEFIAFQCLTFYVLSLFSRLDGYLYIPKYTSIVVSIDGFVEQYSKVLSFLGLLFATSLLSIYFEITYRNILTFLLVLLIAVFITVIFYSWNAVTRRFIDNRKKIYIIFLTSYIIFIFDNIFNSKEKEILVIILVLVSIILPSFYIVRDVVYMLLDEKSKIKNLIGGLFFSEFLAADQSKKNAENLVIINSIFIKSSRNATDILDFFSKNLNLAFIKPDKYRESFKSVNSLDLKLNEDFKIFIDNANKEVKESNLISDLKFLKDQYINNKRSYTEKIMDARTENIKTRNYNNLIISIVIFLIVFPFIYLVNTSLLDSLILKFLIWMIFIRMVLRTFEIGKAFSSDLMGNGYKNSFLTTKDRIILAIKSVIEICFLAASIYQLNTSFLTNNSIFNWCTNFSIPWWKTIEYSLSVAILNISFPEALIPLSNRNFVWLSTHLIQVVSSIILITIAINSYIGRNKNSVYFDFINVKNKKVIIIKKVKFSTDKERVIVEMNLVPFKNKSSFIDGLTSILRTRLRNNEISEEDYDHVLKMIKTQDYFLPYYF